VPVKNPSAALKRRWNLATRYRLVPEDVEAMRAAQGGLCALCDKAPRRWVIDHDHATNRVRALLCHPCNVALAHIEDRALLDRALAYLARYAA
jgi:hypothetical protein